MTNELLIAIEFSRNDWSKQASKLFEGMPGVRMIQWMDTQAEKGELAVKSIPDIIIIDDNPERGPLAQRAHTIKLNFPQAALFVVSSDKDPQKIIQAMKAGVAEYLVEPVSDNALQNVIEEVRAKLANEGKLAQGSIYSFISAKGGVGATVMATNTAAAMAMNTKQNIALLDMCFQSGDASVLLDIVPSATILDICRNIHRLDVAFLNSTMASHKTGLNFLAAPPDPEDTDEISSEHIASILELAPRIYDQVIIDCTSMHVTNCTVEAFRRSDKVFIVSDMSMPSIRNTVRLFKLIRKLGIEPNHIEIIINRYLKHGPLSLGTIEKNFEKQVFWLAPNDFADIVASINRGVPLVKLNASADFSKNISLLARKIQNQLDDPNFRGIRGTFGRSL